MKEQECVGKEGSRKPKCHGEREEVGLAATVYEAEPGSDRDNDPKDPNDGVAE